MDVPYDERNWRGRGGLRTAASRIVPMSFGLCILAVASFIGLRLLALCLYNREATGLARIQLIALYDSVQPGDTLDTFSAKYSALDTSMLNMRYRDECQCAFVHTPTKSRADNWVLQVHFLQGTVDRMEIRTLDTQLSDKAARPFDAPPDKGSAETSEAWRYHPFWGYYLEGNSRGTQGNQGTSMIGKSQEAEQAVGLRRWVRGACLV